MTEPATTAVAATWAATLSGITLSLLGLDYYSLLAAFIGALMALGHAEQMAMRRAVLYVALSTFVGAALGSAFHAWVAASARPVLIIASIVGGCGAQVLVAALIRAAVSRIDKIGGRNDDKS